MYLLVYIDFSFGNFDNSIYERNITELFYLGMLNSFFSKFEPRPLKFEINSNFVYKLVKEK